MQFHAAIFPEAALGRRGIYAEMARVFAASVEAVSPRSRLVLHTHRPDRSLQSSNLAKRAARQSFVDNTDKMRAWHSIAASQPDGTRFALVDADMFATGELAGLADFVSPSCPLAFTFRREGFRFPFNSGAVAVYQCAESRRFFDEWRAVNEDMLRNAKLHQEFRARYGGINQAALGAMLEAEGCPTFARLDCATWNCEDSEWRNFSSETKLVHVKGRLRIAVRSNEPPKDEDLMAIWELWKGYSR